MGAGTSVGVVCFLSSADNTAELVGAVWTVKFSCGDAVSYVDDIRGGATLFSKTWRSLYGRETSLHESDCLFFPRLNRLERVLCSSREVASQAKTLAGRRVGQVSFALFCEDDVRDRNWSRWSRCVSPVSIVERQGLLFLVERHWCLAKAPMSPDYGEKTHRHKESLVVSP